MSIRLTGAGLLLLAGAVVLGSGPLLFLGGCLLLTRWGAALWVRAVVRGLRVQRGGAGEAGAAGPLVSRAFFGGEFALEARVSNGAALSLPWLRLRETLPAALALPNYRLEVTALPPRGGHTLRYRLPARRRGLHAVGPLYLTVGDPLGLEERSLVAGEPTYLLVYPRVMSLTELDLPSAALLGSLRARRPLVGDPSRFAGVRAYQRGDAVHDVHWRATAAQGRLQVRQYDAATETQTTVFLNLDAGAYVGRGWRSAHAVELAITCAASLAWALEERRQPVGLIATGALALPPRREAGDLLPLAVLGRTPAPTEVVDGAREVAWWPGGAHLASGKGRGHLMRALEALARLDVAPGDTFARAVLDQAARLPWGATAVVVTGAVDERLWAALHRLREAGARVLVVLIDEGAAVAAARRQAQLVGVKLWAVWHEDSLTAGPL